MYRIISRVYFSFLFHYSNTFFTTPPPPLLKKSKKNNTPVLSSCLTGHCSVTTPNSSISAIFDYFDSAADETFCQFSHLTLS